MSNKTYFLIELLKIKRKLTMADLCKLRICPVVLKKEIKGPNEPKK